MLLTCGVCSLTMVYESRPDVKYSCDVSYDPFLLLQKENKVYGEGFR